MVGVPDPTAYASYLLIDFFDEAARRFPDRIAVEIPPGRERPARRFVTYAEIARQSHILARRLTPVVRGECIVATLLARGTELLYSSQLAALRAGAAYAPLDPAFPDSQIRDVLEDSEAVAVFTDTAGVARLASAGIEANLIDVDEAIGQFSGGLAPATRPDWLGPANLAYLIYTSGTTGRPKGVMIEHRSIANLVVSDIGEYRLSPDDRVGQNSSAAYDSSIEETWLAFASGATLVVIDDETVRLGPDLIPWLANERLTVFCPPPTLLRATGCENPQDALPGLRFVYLGGEPLPRDIADRWAPGRLLINGYGPTECAVTCTRDSVTPGEPITIGWPVPGMEALVLDEHLEEVPEGESGELCMRGIGLARGYRNSPELTAAKFPIHPRHGHIYRTGDLVQRQPDGRLIYLGRIDAQVKVRGYRIELEAIEARLVECPGVRYAACRVQGEGAHQTVVGFVVPRKGSDLKEDDLKAALHEALPPYMVPSRIGFLDVLPQTGSGKLDRKRLPMIEDVHHHESKEAAAPTGTAEGRIAEAFRTTLGLREAVLPHDDFFNDLGGDSLMAALLVSRLRSDTLTASITVRDLYEVRTVAGLAALAETTLQMHHRPEPVAGQPKGNQAVATVVQGLWLLLELVVGAPIAYYAMFRLLPWLAGEMSLVTLILLAPVGLLVAVLLYGPIAVGIAVLVKKALVGTYRPLREPVWGGFYVRNWIVQQTARLIPWWLLEGTEFHCMALRTLGARIGRRVHIHRGVDLNRGGWDLLEIGDEATLGQESTVRIIDFEEGKIVAGPISIGAGANLEVRAGLGPGTVMEPASTLAALSSLPPGGRIPAGERWDGVPARPAGQSIQVPEPAGKEIPQLRHGVGLILAKIMLWAVLGLPFDLAAIGFALASRVDSKALVGWLSDPVLDWPTLLGIVALVTATLPIGVFLEAIAARAMGRVEEGTIPRWSWSYIRVWLKSGLVDSANEWLSGSLFWPAWLRVAGAKIGPKCEISTIIDVVPELIEIGPETFFADGIYLGGPRVDRGTVTLSKVSLGTNTFLGNHAVVAAGQKLPDDILLGICTVADDHFMSKGKSWFGHPPFELPRREIVEMDRSLTHEPPPIRYLNRLLWECLRFVLPAAPVTAFLAWLDAVAYSEATMPLIPFLFVAVPLWSLAAAGSLSVLVLVSKWSLLGRVRPGNHGFWSCWCSRWDLLYVAWGLYARAALTRLEGTLFLTWFLRATGMKIGRRVVLAGGFSQVVDPDMIVIEDDATVSAMFQAHTFEDRVLKIDRILIRRGATLASGTVPLYGADVGEGAYVAPHSVIMKRERLMPGLGYEGVPTRPQHAPPDALVLGEPHE